MAVVASQGSTLFKTTLREQQPRDRMNGRGFSNICPVSLLIIRTHGGEDETLTMDRFAGEKAGPDLLLPAPPYHFMSLFLAPPGQGQGTQPKTFCRLCGRLCCTRIGHRLTPHPKTEGLEGLSRVSSRGKPVGKGQNERRMLHSAVTEEYLSLPIGKEKGLLLLGIINQWV